MNDKLIGRATIELDELLQDPELVRRLAAATHERLPRWLADQFDSAERTALDRLQGAVESGHFAGFDLVAPADIQPAWVRLSVINALLVWIADRGRTCQHNPRPHRPQPVVAAAWRPGLVVCAECTFLLTAHSEKADRTCDGCGKVTAGVKAGDPIYPSQVSTGLFQFAFGLCSDCQQEFDPSPRV